MRAIRLASIASFLLLALAGPVAARGGMPAPLTPRGEIIEGIYYQIFIAATITVLIVVALMAWVIIRYRANSGHGRATFEHERENLRLELTWIIIPLFVVLWIGYISYAGLVQLDEGIENEDTFMEIEVIGQKWFWTAVYDDFKVDAFYDATGTVNEGAEFYVPADVPILLNVTGADVIHSFSIQEGTPQNPGVVILTVDANPSGPHQYNTAAMEFPVGEYHVQCREMCFNPGHGYMRAKIISVPMADYNVWYEEYLAAANTPKLAFPIEITDEGIDAPLMKTAPGSAVRLQFANDASEDRTFTIGGETLEVPAGSLVPFDIRPDEAGNIDITDGQNNLVLEVVQPQEVTVELGDFFISPTSFTLEAGELYRINVVNVGASPHNLFIGDYVSSSDNDPLWISENINGDQTTTMLVLAQEPMDFVTWCDIPGHAQSGMLASMTAQ
ncbi:MAG: cytochrome c oxidase subunit II transmembrane domain-containing protein [Thermoplasmatota archaeon]